jgi:AcrR family transcriptional regulator
VPPRTQETTGAKDTKGRTAARRRYRSPLRAQQAEQTRRAVVAAARELFLTKGWTATGMREVAARAEVALETVYSHYSSKKGLLRAVIDEAAVGDDVPVPLAERPEFLALGRRRRSARLLAAARLATTLHVRTAAIAELLREAAPTDDEIAEVLQATRERQRLDVATALELIVGRAPTADERDGVWAVISPEVWSLLVDESGWSPEQYEAWVAATLAGMVPRS